MFNSRSQHHFIVPQRSLVLNGERFRIPTSRQFDSLVRAAAHTLERQGVGTPV